MQKFLDLLVSKLPTGVQPYAKALVPLAVGAVLVAQDLTISVTEVNELKTLGIAAFTSLFTLLVRNIGE